MLNINTESFDTLVTAIMFLILSKCTLHFIIIHSNAKISPVITECFFFFFYFYLIFVVFFPIELKING